MTHDWTPSPPPKKANIESIGQLDATVRREYTMKNITYSKLSDSEMAGMVRMLMRSDLNHESVCVGARDRIMYLSQQLEKLKSAVEHAKYLADAAQSFIEELNKHAIDGEGYQTSDSLSDHWSGLNCAIHDFKKRA